MVEGKTNIGLLLTLNSCKLQFVTCLLAMSFKRKWRRRWPSLTSVKLLDAEEKQCSVGSVYQLVTKPILIPGLIETVGVWFLLYALRVKYKQLFVRLLAHLWMSVNIFTVSFTFCITLFMHRVWLRGAASNFFTVNTVADMHVGVPEV